MEERVKIKGPMPVICIKVMVTELQLKKMKWEYFKSWYFYFLNKTLFGDYSLVNSNEWSQLPFIRSCVVSLTLLITCISFAFFKFNHTCIIWGNKRLSKRNVLNGFVLIVGNGACAHYEQMCHFPQCFLSGLCLPYLA